MRLERRRTRETCPESLYQAVLGVEGERFWGQHSTQHIDFRIDGFASPDDWSRDPYVTYDEGA